MVPLAHRLAAMPPQSRRTRIRDRPPRKAVRKSQSGDGKSSSDDEEAGREADGSSTGQAKINMHESGTDKAEDEEDDLPPSDDEDEMMPITGPGTDGTAGYAGTVGPEGDSEEAERERAYKRCEGWGYRVGQGVAER